VSYNIVCVPAIVILEYVAGITQYVLPNITFLIDTLFVKFVVYKVIVECGDESSNYGLETADFNIDSIPDNYNTLFIINETAYCYRKVEF
jgi:hypothetical protein